MVQVAALEAGEWKNGLNHFRFPGQGLPTHGRIEGTWPISPRVRLVRGRAFGTWGRRIRAWARPRSVVAHSAPFLGVRESHYHRAGGRCPAWRKANLVMRPPRGVSARVGIHIMT